MATGDATGEAGSSTRCTIEIFLVFMSEALEIGGPPADVPEEGQDSQGRRDVQWMRGEMASPYTSITRDKRSHNSRSWAECRQVEKWTTFVAC